MKRCSPVQFGSKAVKTDVQDNWSIVLEYEAEGNGPWLIDLSHKVRWDLQDADMSRHQVWGVPIPNTPGHCVFGKGILINRMNQTQASIWHLSEQTVDIPDDPAFTDVTDANVFLALLGKEIFSITEKLTSLDFFDPLKRTPFLLQGPFSHVPCQLVTLEKTTDRSGLLFTCSRGYAQDMIAAIFKAGEEFKLNPAGENIFSEWIRELLM